MDIVNAILDDIDTLKKHKRATPPDAKMSKSIATTGSQRSVSRGDIFYSIPDKDYAKILSISRDRTGDYLYTVEIGGRAKKRSPSELFYVVKPPSY